MRSCREVSDSRFSSRMMFSPKVLKDEPCLERVCRILLGSGGLGCGEVWAVTMYCSLRTSLVRRIS